MRERNAINTNAVISFTKMDYSIPEQLDSVEYQKYCHAFEQLQALDLFKKAYVSDDGLNGDKLYFLSFKKWNQKDKDQLVANFIKVNKDQLRSKYIIELVAYYIHCHRIDCNRIGHEVDDYVKAEYLLAHRNKIEGSLDVIWLKQDTKLERLIDEVNNIFDTAYFRKINYPALPDTTCFFDAEKEYRDKTLKIKYLANQRYQWRMEKNMEGDDKGDWRYAEDQYSEWQSKNDIAEICWLTYSDKQKSQDFYWTIASLVIQELDQLAIPWIEKDPSESPIKDYIDKHVKLQESMLTSQRDTK
jgi:hypothetical protein